MVEVVNQVDYKRSVVFLFFQHLEDEILKSGTVAGMDSLRVLVQNRLEESLHGVLNEWRLETSSVIKSDSHAPNIASLVVVLVLNDFR